MAFRVHTEPSAATELLGHLEVQLESARRLLSIVLEQGAAIRRREVARVVAMAGSLQVEIHRRELIESERVELLKRAAAELGVEPDTVTLTMLREQMDPETAEIARLRQRELRGLLRRIQREHTTNRALMAQELNFLDHLLRLAGGAVAYGAGGRRASTRTAAKLMGKTGFNLEA